MLYEPVLVVHVIAAVLLIGGGLLLVGAGVGLTSLVHARELRPWAALARGSAPLAVGAGVALFASGGHLAGTSWSFAEGWITVSAGWLAVLGIATLVLYRRLGALAEELRETDDGEVPASLGARLRSPATWAIAHALVLGGIAFIPVMVLKTGFAGSAGWLLGGSATGVVSGVLTARRGARDDLAVDAAGR